MKVGIAGITGKFARHLVAHLENDNITTVKGYCRNPAKLPEALRSSSKLELIQGDAFDNNAIRSFVQGCDGIVCCYLGDDKLMVDGQKLLIDACDIETSITRHVASDWALDYTKLKHLIIHVKACQAECNAFHGPVVHTAKTSTPYFIESSTFSNLKISTTNL